MESITNLIVLIDNEPRISHRIIADETKTQHKNVAELIGKYSDNLKLFGKLPFKTEAIKNSKNRVNEQKTYFLNEPQATLLLTLMRNNDIVIDFKVRLVQEFFKMRTQLQISTPEKPKNLISVSTEDMRKEFEALDFLLNKIQFSEKEKIEFINQTLEKINFQTLKNPHIKKREAVFTLTQLLAEFQISISTKDFNLKLESFGIIERFGSGWILLEMRFGENRETQNGKNHRYYKLTFQKLLDIVL